jgi:hypothetical protein
VRIAVSVPLSPRYPASYIFIYNLSQAIAPSGRIQLEGDDAGKLGLILRKFAIENVRKSHVRIIGEFRSFEDPTPGYGSWDGAGTLVLQVVSSCVLADGRT